jgi:hypothetical protein
MTARSGDDCPPDPPAPVDRQRREPLPWCQPKPADEDPDAPRRVTAIMAHPAYRQADQDTGFLADDSTRGARLQLDYAKAELLLTQAGVERTVVVFGSTRIREPATAARRVAELRVAAAGSPDAAAARRLAIAERLHAKSHYYEMARAFGRLVGEAWDGGSGLVLMTGGGPGIMEAANRGAWETGAPTIGLNIALPHEQYPNPYITPGLCFSFHYFALRKLHFLKRACALVAFPGGYGTFDEIFETLTLVQTRKIEPVPVVLVGAAYWRRVVDIDALVDEGVIDAEDRDLFWFAESAAEAWDGIRAWHARAGRPLTGPRPG